MKKLGVRGQLQFLYIYNLIYWIQNLLNFMKSSGELLNKIIFLLLARVTVGMGQARTLDNDRKIQLMNGREKAKAWSSLDT